MAQIYIISYSNSLSSKMNKSLHIHIHTQLFRIGCKLILKMCPWLNIVCHKYTPSTICRQVFQVCHQGPHTNLSLNVDHTVPSCPQRSMVCPASENWEQGMCLTVEQKNSFYRSPLPLQKMACGVWSS